MAEALQLDHDSDFGRLPLDHWVLVIACFWTFTLHLLTLMQQWWDYTNFSNVFPPFARLPVEIRQRIEFLNHCFQVAKLTKLYIEDGLALREVGSPPLPFYGRQE